MSVVDRVFANRSLRRFIRRSLRTITSPQIILSILILIIVGYLIIVPLANLALTTLKWGEGDYRISPDAVTGAFTLEHWKRVLISSQADRLMLEPLSHTLLVGVFASALALTLGGLLAWLVTRTDLPGREWLRTLLIIPYLLPSFALALAWTTLFKSGAVGGRPGVYEALLGQSPPAWITYGPVPITIVLAVHYFPFALLVVSGALSTLDAQLEEGAELLGASRWTILRKITFPLVTPAFLSALALTFGRTVGNFSTPALLGLPNRYYLLSTMIFSNIAIGLESNGYILALVLTILASITVYINTRVLGASARFVTIGGKGFKANPVKLKQWRWPIFILVFIFVLLWVLMPLGLLSYQTVMAYDGVYSLDNFTLHYWAGESDPKFAHGEPGVFRNDGILGSIWNSLRLAILGAALGAIFGLVIGYIVVRIQNRKLANLIDQVSYLPFLVPGIAFGAMYLSQFAVKRGPIPALYGTFWLLVLAVTVKNLPYTTRTGASAVVQIGKELEEAAELQGATWFKRFRWIVLPLASSGVVSGMMITFITIMRELALIIILITPSTRVLMSMSYRYTEEGQIQLSNALVLIVITLTMIGEIIVWRLGRGRFATESTE
jgi:iron(III) transport system permease protein